MRLETSYINNKDWFIPYNQIFSDFDWQVIGYSSEEHPILSYKIGSGNRKACLWAGMHGNETTGIFVLLALIDLFQKKHIELGDWELNIVPVINPDAYVRYSRRNGLGVDMNRDFRSFQTLESSKLIGWIRMINPDLCFNLHDQRTIFRAGNASAYTSLLVPSFNEERTINDQRRDLMNVVGNAIDTMGISLEGIGRYTDEFYPTAVGDYLMKEGIPNILIESGVAKGDLLRLKARKFALDFILSALTFDTKSSKIYDRLPINTQGQFEWVFTNVLYARMRVDVAIKQIRYVNGHHSEIRYAVDDIGDLASRPRLLEMDGTGVSLSEPLQLDGPATGDFGDYIFENGVLVHGLDPWK